MKKIHLFIIAIFIVFPNFSYSSPKTGFADLLVTTEQNPELVKYAQNEAIRQNLPISIISTDGIMINVRSLENGKPVYTVITNFADIYNGGYTAFHEEFVNKINYSNSRIDYGNGRITDNTNGYFNVKLNDSPTSSTVLMIPDSQFDRVYLFDSFNGNLIDTSFIPQTRPQLQTPIHALQHFSGSKIIVSDQISDAVQEFNPNGIYTSIFAPAGGVNTAILDNIRGICYRPNNNLLVTVGSGANQNTIQQFDIAGNPLGTFIPSTNLSSPFDIFYKQNEILIACSSAPNDISKYDLNGNFISVLHSSTSLNFAEQMLQLGNGDIVVAGFSPPSGLVILDSTGVYKRTLNVVTGNRGVYLLGNGNYLTTSGTAVYELDSSTGGIIRTVVSSTNQSFRFISEYTFTSPSLRLTINLESCPSQQMFNAELRNSSSPYNLIDSQSVMAGAGIPAVVSFPAGSSGVNYYIVLKGKNSVETWSSNPVSFNSNFLKYNFTTAVTQAYGNNMINAGGKWSFYQGDVTQNGFVDLTDVLIVYEDASLFTTGNAVTDINCDNIVDLSDILVTSNNTSNFVQVVRP
ncbi:MAG: hypothetical protein IPL53_19980 [Ignavibacteria bacterium]|nr:hypothetical protein [Ignavibacteria bacterium]